MLLNKQVKIILKVFALILIILFINNQISPQHFIEEAIQSIVENEDADNINAPKELINDIESIYTFSEENGFPKPEYIFKSDKIIKVKGKSYYRVLFLTYKISEDIKLGDDRVFDVLIDIEGSFPKYRIMDYRIISNNFDE